jgi:hypothetical protein
LWEVFFDPSIWYTYMALVTKYQISAINSYWEKCDEKYLGRTEVKQYTPPPPSGSGGIIIKIKVIKEMDGRTYKLSHFFSHIFLSNCWWQKSDIWSQASYRYTILWVAFLDPSDSYFLFADLVGFYTHWTYVHIFRHIFLSNYCKSANRK